MVPYSVGYIFRMHISQWIFKDFSVSNGINYWIRCIFSREVFDKKSSNYQFIQISFHSNLIKCGHLTFINLTKGSHRKNYETYYRSARVQVWSISKYFLTISNNFLALSWSISVYLSLFWTILVYLGRPGKSGES